MDDTKLAGGWYFPAHEKHFLEWMEHPKNRTVEDGRLQYQHKKQRMFRKYCKAFRTVADCGAHIGTWSFNFAKEFQTVHAFEPVALHRECFIRNVTAPNVILHPEALGAAPGRVAMWTEEGSSGNSHIRGEGDIELRTLDSYELQDVDAVKVDAEGYELFILQGAEQTLLRWKPAIVVEQKPHVMSKTFGTGADAIKYLESLGAVVREVFSGDYFLTWG